MSQRGNVELLDRLTGQTHDVFVGDVKDLVRRSSVTSMLMQNAPPGMFKFSGQKCKFAVDLKFQTCALPTGGNIPDYVPMDALLCHLIATRRYARFALDNFIELVASGEGSFEDIGE